MTGADTGRIVALDGLRCVAVSLVILSHAAEAYLPTQASSLWLAPLVNGSLGVRLFFVLSGFLITTLLLREQERRGWIDWKAFLMRRCLRIWPALYAYLAIMALLTQFDVLNIAPDQFLAAATFTWNYSSLWIRDGTAQGSWFLGHLWTLALEQQFYLAWPALIALAGWRRACWVALTAPILLPAIRVLWYFAFPEQRGQLGMMFHTAVDSILIGCAFALYQARLRCLLERYWKWVLPVTLAFVFLVSPLIATTLTPYRVTFGFGLEGIACGLLILAAERSGRWSRFLNLRPLVFIGTISYGLYIWQQPFLTTWNSTPTGTFPLSLITAFLCALASFHLVEQPFLRAKQLFKRAALR